jgi:DNA polymerase delta subunit 3
MLYGFHHNENGKKPQSVNATYIVTGVQKAPAPAAANAHNKGEGNNGGDFPTSSPYLGSSMPNQDDIPDTVTTASVLLVREEDLEGRELYSFHNKIMEPSGATVNDAS